jgi:hypothetical protein
MDSPARMAAGAEGREAAGATVVEDRFGQDTARGVARAEKEDVETHAAFGAQQAFVVDTGRGALVP